MQGARGEDQGGPAQAGGAGAGSALRALRAGRPEHRLSPAQGDDGRTPGRAHRHRVPDAGRAFGQRRAGADPRAPAITGLGTGQGRRLRAGEKHRQEAAPQAGRRRRQPRIHPHRAECRLSDAGRGGGGEAVTDCSWLLMRDGGCPLPNPYSLMHHLLERYPGS